MSRRLRRRGSFGEVVYENKSRIWLVYLFFIGFVATGLAYALVTGELRISGTTNYMPGTSLTFTQPHMPARDGNDHAHTILGGQTLSFHFEFDATHHSEFLHFCINNTSSVNVQLGAPIVTNPTDPNVSVVWPALQNVIVPANTESCNPIFVIEAFYTDESPSDLVAEMSLRLVYAQV